MRFVIDLVYLLAIVVISPKIIYRMLLHNRYRGGWSERLGKVRRRWPNKKCVWIHAVSVGEVNATKTLVAKLNERLSDYEIVISATTDTGLARAKALYGNDLAVFYFPFDMSFVMQRAFHRLKPSICLLMELEIWPNLTRIAADKNVPVVVVNGRISDRSFPRYKLIRPAIKRMFGKVSLVLAQTQQYAERFKALGCAEDKVIVTNSLKYDTARIADKVEGSDELAQQLNIAERLWVAGGTGPGEEKILLEVFAKLKNQERFADIRLAIVPRKPERFDEVAELIRQAGFEFVRYSSIKTRQSKVQNTPAVILGDTMGDLKKFYSLATATVFVGRSLVPMGGSDMMEPTAMGKCTLFGRGTFNFRQTVDALLAGRGAIEVADGTELFETIQKCLTNTEFARRIAVNAREVIKQNQGATERSVNAITELLIKKRR